MRVQLDHLKKTLTKWWQKKLCNKSDSINLDDITKKPLPDYFLRGFSNNNCFTTELNVAIGAFQFSDFTQERVDDYHEASINWEDTPDAVTLLLNQKRENTDDLMFKYGYARLPLNLVKTTLNSFISNQYLDFERKPLVNNPFHGNILIKGGIKKAERSMIQNILAAIANNDKHLKNI